MLSFVVNLWRRAGGGIGACGPASLEDLEPRRLLSGKVHHAHAPRHHAGSQKPTAIKVSAGQTNGVPASGPSPIIGTGAIVGPGAGHTFYAMLGSFNGAAGEALAAALQNADGLSNFVTIAWGDGSSSQGVIEADDSGNLDVIATHKYAATGTFNIGVVVTQGPQIKPGKPMALFSTRIIGMLFGGAVAS